MVRHGEHGHDAVVVEGIVVPVALFVAAGVDGADAAVDAVDADFVGRDPDYGTEAVVRVVDCGGVLFLPAFVEDPEGGYWGGPVGRGDAGEG